MHLIGIVVDAKNGNCRGAQECHAMQDLGPEGLRLVRLPASELSSVEELGRTLKQHPRVRFVVLCDPFQLSASSAAALISALSGLSLPIAVTTG